MTKQSLCLIVMIVGAVPALADMSSSNAWYQTFTVNDTEHLLDDNKFDELRLQMMVGSLTEPGMTNLNEIVFSENGPLSVIGSGNNIGEMTFDLTFEGPLADSVVFELWLSDQYAFGDTVMSLPSGLSWASWDGSDWSIADFSMTLVPVGEPEILAHTPLPAAVVLGMLGLGVAGWQLRKQD
jgi:hypothetical protein